MNIITGYRGEPHITAQEDRDINLGLVGKSTTELYVLDVGQQLEAEIVSANEIRVKDGVLVMQGCAASIDYGTYDSLTISNGSQGMQRIDVIAAQYERDGDTNVETVSLVVIEGTPAASHPNVPSLTGGSIQGGDSLVQMPLYYVNLDGVSIDSIDSQFKMATNLDLCTLSDATQTKWNAIAGGASNDEIMDYLADEFTDSGWQELASGVQYRKVLGIVYIHFYITSASLTTTYKTIGTLPVGYRPNTTLYGICGTSGGVTGRVALNDSGVLTVRTETGTASAAWWQVSYPADN